VPARFEADRHRDQPSALGAEVVASNLPSNPSDDYPHWSGPSDEYLYWYVSVPLHQWFARCVGYDEYLKHWRQLERAIRRAWNTPPVMAYDAMIPDLAEQMAGLLIDCGVDPVKLSDEQQARLARLIEQQRDTSHDAYHRGVERALIKIFLRVGVKPGMTFDFAAHLAGFTATADKEHYRGPDRLFASRRTIRRAFAKTIALTPRTGKLS
jgi:hypothetical protein